MFVAPAILSLIASVAAAGFPTVDLNTNGFNGIINPCCPVYNNCDTVPTVWCVKGFDAFLNGPFSREYRAQLASLSHGSHHKKRSHAALAKVTYICIDFGVTNISISCDEFKRAVHETICVRECIKIGDLCEEARTRMDTIIAHIYAAVEKSNGSDFDLFIFTAIAMFNHNSFTRFPDPNTHNDEHRCRGLLQIRSDKYYRLLKKHGHHDYLKHRYLLDSFSAISIRDEFSLYKAEFAGRDGSRSVHSMMRHTVIKMASFEGQVLDDVGSRDIDRIHNRELRDKLQNRFSILDHLLFFISDNDSLTQFSNE